MLPSARREVSSPAISTCMQGGGLPCGVRVRPEMRMRRSTMRRNISQTGCAATAAARAREMSSRAKPEPGRLYVLTAETSPEVEQPNDVEALHATIVAESDAAIETLSVRDAVMRLDLAVQQVLMFRNFKNGQLNVVYRRRDGHVGWIDPGA